MGLLNRAENGAQTQLSQKPQPIAQYQPGSTKAFLGYPAANIEVIVGQETAAQSKPATPPPDSALALPRSAVHERNTQSVSSYGATASVRAPRQTTPEAQLTVANKLQLMGIPVVSVVPNKQVVILFNDKEVKLVKRSAAGVGVNLPPDSARLLHDTLSLNKLSFLDLVSELTPNDVSRVARPKSSWLGGIFR